MAKEKAPDPILLRSEQQNDVAASKKKKKKRKDSDAGVKKRPKYCPNSSKNGNRSFNLSRSRVICRASETALKKNNEQLAKALNSHKITIGELRAELVLKDRRIQEVMAEAASLRQAAADPALVEAELLRRIAAAVAPIRASLEGAVDCLVQTSEHVTKGLQLASQPSRQSSISQARLSSQQHRHSSICPSFQMRSVAPSRSGETSTSTSPSLVSKVGPMVAGHAISRPRIQLTRMDEAAMAAARERQAEDLGLAPPHPQAEQQPAMVDHPPEDEYDDIGASPEHPGRSRFNMTNIVEESRLEESRLEASGVLEEEDEDEEERTEGLQILQEEPDNLTPTLNRSIQLQQQPTVRLSPCRLSPLEQATPSRYRLSVGRGVTPRAPVLHSSEEGSSSQPVSKTSLRRAPQPARPPNPIRLSISQPSTPLAPPSPEAGTSSSASPFIPDNPSESFLEALAQDPGEGPSWLFNDNSKGKKKKRSSTARQLSALFSESERESGATTGASTSGMDTSDISLEEPGSADSSLEVSGFLLAKDLRQSKSAVYSTAPSTPSLAAGDNEEVEERMKDNKENRAGQEEKEEKSPSKLSISVSSTPGRRPLEEMAVDGGVVTYCPRLETGATVASLRTASILLKNVGTKGSPTEGNTTPYRLSECYVAVSPGRSMSLDQLLSLGLKAGQEEGRTPSVPTRAKGNPGKRASSPVKRQEDYVGSPGKRKATSPAGGRSLGNLGEKRLGGPESPLSKRARSCTTARRIYSEEDPVEEECQDEGQGRKRNVEEDDFGATSLTGGGVEGSNSLSRELVDGAGILEVVPDQTTEPEVVSQLEPEAMNSGGKKLELEVGKSPENSEETSSRGSRQVSRHGRVRSSVVYTESPIMESKRVSKKSEGAKRNPKSGRVSPIDPNDINQSEKEVPKKKQAKLSGHEDKNIKETSKKISLVKAGGSRRAMEDDGSKTAQAVEVEEDLAQATSSKRGRSSADASSKMGSSAAGEASEENRGKSEEKEEGGRGRRARAQVSYALPSLNTKMRRNH